jgi:hypothetical protein
MFRRGQRIRIKKSSAVGGAHPAEGDTGYLNNMYLFCKHRFILMDAHFFAYRSDAKGKSVRCEKKKFIIDLGMRGHLKRQLMTSGVRKNWFINNKCIINLASAGHWATELIDQGVAAKNCDLTDIPSVYGFYGIWPKRHSVHNTPIKIPFGQIAAAPGRYALQQRPWKEIECWMRCIYPLVNAQLTYFRSNGDHSLQARILDIYLKKCSIIYGKDSGNGLMFKVRMEDMTRKKLFNMIEGLKQIQVLSDIYLNNLDGQSIKELHNMPDRGRIPSIWDIDGIVGLSQTTIVAKHRAQALVSIFVRSILSNTGEDYANYIDHIGHKMIMLGGLLPWTHKIIMNKIRNLEEMRKCATTDSAALARIYEEKILY